MILKNALWLSILLAAVILAQAAEPPPASPPAEPLTLLVMDPLALPLSCPCVKGYAQRRYEQLGAFLESRLARPVRVLYGDDIAKTLCTGRVTHLDLIIGKDSVVAFDARANDLALRPALRLTGRDGATTQRGLFVVRQADRARRLADLQGYRFLFGPPECAEKFQAAADALTAAGVALPAQIESRPGCSDAAQELLAQPAQQPTAAVISSYAAALLEGCGQVPKGALRIVGETRPVPFITVFFAEALEPALAARLRDTLLAVGQEPALLEALESRAGFVPLAEPPAASAAPAAWPGWRGPHRDGRVAHLPARLPTQPKIIWTRDLPGRGLAGLAATAREVIVADRTAADDQDLILCLDADTGAEHWRRAYPTEGQIRDYGNAPRATPLIEGERVYTLGGLGNLQCLRLRDGEVLWTRHLARDFQAGVPTWGYCASPLLVDGRLIVNPGAPDASLVALDAATGRECWRCPGLPAAYASFIIGTFGGRRQLVGYDEKTLGGWDPATGERLWTLVPPNEGDFNVPTPIDAGGQLLLTTENNGTRLYGFDPAGRLRQIGRAHV